MPMPWLPRGSIALTLFVFALAYLSVNIDSRVVSKVEQVNIVFARHHLPFTKPILVRALDGLTISFDKNEALIGVAGPSGSGKSTLAQFLRGNIRSHASTGGLEIIAGAKVCYMDNRYYLNYDGEKDLAFNFGSVRLTTNGNILRLLESLSILSDIPMNSLTESKRRLAEVLLCLQANGVFDGEKGASAVPFLVILDEYSDKDVKIVTQAFFKALRVLCNAFGEEVPGQVLIITHSRKVATLCDSLVVLKSGSLFAQGHPSRVLQNIPSEMIILD